MHEMIDKAITEYIRHNSGFEPDRNYLGMSQIGYCARRQYNQFLEGKKPGDRDHRNAIRGYYLEKFLNEIVADLGFLKPASTREVVSNFDIRFRGHTDGETFGNDLVEFKTMTQKKFDELRGNRRLSTAHFMQMQAYMRYGGYERGYYIALSTETFEHCVISVIRNVRAGDLLEEKAKKILAAIDSKVPPPCECNGCLK